LVLGSRINQIVTIHYDQNHHEFSSLAIISCYPHHHSGDHVIRLSPVLVTSRHLRIRIVCSIRKNCFLTLENRPPQKQTSLAQTTLVAIPASVPAKSTPPSSGYSRQKVSVEGLGDYLVDIIAGDLGSTKVIVDTASSSNCGNDCPVLPLATYVSRTGAYAGVNGSYFCPASYPSCAGKTNSFDLLLMNKDKSISIPNYFRRRLRRQTKCPGQSQFCQ